MLFSRVPHQDEARRLAEDDRQSKYPPGVIRGRRPKSESWPKAERKGSVRPQPDRGGGRQPRRNGLPPSVSPGNDRRTEEEALQAARARVAKLEASAVGESALQEALRQAQKHAQVP